ncbi:MAG: hypothetical protein MUO72_16555 [Bacteroidales bacterium]|nr:hypothetical protein [Bacteroidales bacterium]
MKKLIVSIGSILIMVFVVVLFVNAGDSKKETKKVKTEVKKDEATAPCSAACIHSIENKTATCDPEKCKEMNCDHKDGKCDPATCIAHKEGAQKGNQACVQTAACTGTCHTRNTVVK